MRSEDHETESKFLRVLKHEKAGPIIAVSVLFLLIVGIPILVSAITSAKNNPQFIQGDYSKHNCSSYHCENGATWMYSAYGQSKYYCDDHYEEGQQLYDIATNNKKKDAVEDNYGHDRFDAIVVARSIVKDRLKSPSTAEFCKNSEYTVNCSNNTWIISGYVDAQNSFGATLRNDFTVKFTFTSSEKYTIDSCSID